MVYRAKANA